MASDLISRSALLAEYDRVHVGEPGGARKLMEEDPTVDAVEVVRCKDCEKCDTDWCPSHSEKLEYWCGMIGLVTEPDFFCGYGERKREDATD